MLQNESGLRPKGRAVLVKMIEIEELKANLIKIPDHVKANSAVMEQRAIVVEAGGEAWADEKAPRALPGDKVVVTKMAGYMIVSQKDKQLYRLVNDRDIFCVIEEGAKNG